MAKRMISDEMMYDERVASLSPLAEIFYRCLHHPADVCGTFYADPECLKPAVFPLRDITKLQVRKLRDECHRAGLIELFEAGGREYLRIAGFKRIIGMNPKFPLEGTPIPPAPAENKKVPDPTGINVLGIWCDMYKESKMSKYIIYPGKDEGAVKTLQKMFKGDEQGLRKTIAAFLADIHDTWIKRTGWRLCDLPNKAARYRNIAARTSTHTEESEEVNDATGALFDEDAGEAGEEN